MLLPRKASIHQLTKYTKPVTIKSLPKTALTNSERKGACTAMIQWLHISDLHFLPNTDPDQENLTHALLTDCKNRKIQADFVVATGDFHNFWDTGNYLTSRRFLHTLMDALRLDMTQDLFLVPGNHDVNPVEGPDPVQAFLAQGQEDCTSPDYACTLMKHRDLLDPLLERFRGYRAMAGALLPVYEAGGPDPAGVHVRQWRDRLNILHLNTALLSNGERDHMDAVDLEAACSPLLRGQLTNGLPTLVLGHHSFHDLHPTVKDRLVQLFNQTNVWVYLAGDQHRPNDRRDAYLIDRKTGVKAWPNLVASKLAAATDDPYSEFGVVHHRWDERSTVQVTYWSWAPQSSGDGLDPRPGRTYPMCSDVDSKLYYDLAERLARTRSQHPSFQLMEVDKDLFPQARLQLEECQAQGGTVETPRPLAAFFQESWSSPTQNHLMLEGEGGIGKTVALLSLTTQEHFLPKRADLLHNTQVAEETFAPEGHSGSVNAVAVSSDGQRCVSAPSDDTLRIWDIDTGQCLKVLQPLPGMTLFDVDLSAASITSPALAEVLRQNGARVPPEADAQRHRILSLAGGK